MFPVAASLFLFHDSQGCKYSCSGRLSVFVEQNELQISHHFVDSAEPWELCSLESFFFLYAVEAGIDDFPTESLHRVFDRLALVCWKPEESVSSFLACLGSHED